MNKPTHQHNCDDCFYLGTYEDRRKNQQYDCYWCSIGKDSCPSLSSVLGRYGSEGPEYISSHPPEAFAMKQEYLHTAGAWYLFALMQATRMGLYKPDTSIAKKTYGEVKS